MTILNSLCNSVIMIKVNVLYMISFSAESYHCCIYVVELCAREYDWKQSLV